MGVPTMGGKHFWETVQSLNGWTLQQHKWFKQYRVIDPNNNKPTMLSTYRLELARKTLVEKATVDKFYEEKCEAAKTGESMRDELQDQMSAAMEMVKQMSNLADTNQQ